MAHETDNAWQGILRGHFKECLQMFFPRIHAEIDWRTKLVFLDKELAKLVPEAIREKAVADKLVQVRLRSGKHAFVFLHVEVQDWNDPKFVLRMLRYNVLLREAYGDDVVSLAILTDDRPRYRPNAFVHERWGFSLRMRFPVVKLLDYGSREKWLAANPNPFAVVVLAHLARMGKRNPKDKYRAKLRLMRLLFKRGHTKEQIRTLLRFLDWILRLPDDLEKRIMSTRHTLEHGRPMPFLSNIERWGMQKGLRKGRREGRKEGKEEGLAEGMVRGLHEAIALGLECRFGAAAHELRPRIEAIRSVARLRALIERLKTAPRLQDFVAALERGDRAARR